MSDPVEAFKSDKEKLEKLLNYRDAQGTLGSKGQELASEAVRLMSDDIGQLIECDGECEVEVPDSKRQKVLQVADMLLNKVVFEGIGDWLRDFVVGYVDFCHQWNQKVFQSQRLDNILFASRRIVVGQETMQDTRETLNKVVSKAEKIVERDPESLKLSRHYLRQLRED